MDWLKNRLNEPSTHVALGLILTIATTVAPAKDQPYVLLVASILAVLGFVLPESIQKKLLVVDKGAQPNTKVI